MSENNYSKFSSENYFDWRKSFFLEKTERALQVFLKKYCQHHNIYLKVINPVLNGKSEISSSKIRSLINTGHINEANNLLGSYFTIPGVVVHGSGRGSFVKFQNCKY